MDSNDDEYIVWNWSAVGASRVVVGKDAIVGVNIASNTSAIAWLNIRNETNYIIAQIIAVPARTGDWEAGEPLLES